MTINIGQARQMALYGDVCEPQRLRALLDYKILDTPAEASFDHITSLAAKLFDAPVALISLIDQSRQWFKSRVGIDVAETPREMAFCSHAILSNRVMVVPDAALDPRFQNNPLVLDGFLRFYAGAPLTTADGWRLGTLCVIGPDPRDDFGPQQQDMLAKLAALAVRELEFRRNAAACEAIEAAMQISETRFRGLADTVPGVTYQWFERPDGQRGFSYISPRVREFFGLDPDLLMQDWTHFVIHPDDRERWVQSIAEAVRVGHDWSFEGRLILPDGQVRWWRGLSKPIEGTAAGEILFNGIILDITAERASIEERQNQYQALQASHAELERKRQELQSLASELAAARDAAEHANQAKSDFLASISHELRTPLTAILGFTDLILNDNLSKEDALRYLRMQREAGGALLALINDILDLSKIEAGKLELERVDYAPGALAVSCAAIVDTMARDKGLAVRLDVAPDLPGHMAGDPTRLQQVLLNLLSNAVKFTAQGHIEVSVRRLPGAAALRFSVSDTGIGIAPSALPRLFEHFSQADNSIARRFGGTGLGLAISQRLVRMMGGEIHVESKLGQGSRFWFDLPATAIAAAPKAPVAAPARQAQLGAARILVAEDVEMNQVLIRALLQLIGHEVDFANDGIKAVEAFETKDYDLILMDMQMPNMDGLTATREIRRRETEGRHVPIVALSANAMSEDVERCRAAGMDAHVAKPIDRNQLFATIDRLLKKPAAVEIAGPEQAAPLAQAALAALLDEIDADYSRRSN